MAVIPEGEIRLIPDIALDPRYEHTMWFDSAQEQADYFLSKSTKSFTRMGYQRVGDYAIRVQGTIATLDQMCYMMFRNTAQINHPYGNKWFYAFITSAKYINENTVELTYELDLMQTWLFECHLNKCFVEREHSATDMVGDNIVPENIPVGDYLYTKPVHPVKGELTMNDLTLVIAYNPGFDLYGAILELGDGLHPYVKRYRNSAFSGTYYGIAFVTIDLVKNSIAMVKEAYEKIEFASTILCSFVMPTMFLPEDADIVDYNVRATMQIERNTDFDGYVPSNNKLFTYPYTSAYVTSFRGYTNEFEFEKFAPKGTALFNVEGTLSIQPSVVAYPVNYRKVSKFLEGAVGIPAYPMCTWGEDGFTEWINNNLFRACATVGVAVGGAAVAPAAGTALATVSSAPTALSTTGQMIPMMPDVSTPHLSTPHSSEGVKASVDLSIPSERGFVRGFATSDLLMGIDYGRRIMGFCKHLTYQSARIVDEYFSLYGYATNRVKVPARNNRPCWNYVKTKGCTAHGYLPASDIRAICAIYDRGITFWKKDATIGSYNFEANKLK